MRNLIQFVETKRLADRKLRDDIFHFQPSRGWVRLQKACFWALRKLHCEWVEEKVNYTRHVIDGDVFVAELQRQQHEILNACHRQARHLLIGSDDFADLMNLEIFQRFSFFAEYRCADEGRIEIYGLKVTVIPWMKGMLVLPKDFDA